MNKVIQITNLLPETHFKNCHRGRVFWSKGIAPCLNCNGGGNREPKFLWIRPKYLPPPKKKLRYALGRTNHGDGDDKYGTSKFHVNTYFNTVTAIQMSNRRQLIAEIK